MADSEQEPGGAHAELKPHRRRLAAIITSVVIVAVAALSAVYLVWSPAADDGHVPQASDATLSTLSAPDPAPTQAAQPGKLIIPSLNVNAPVIPVTMDCNVLDPPSNPQQIGWWSGGVRPGASQGSALLAGHAVHDGHGALQDLADADVGERVSVKTEKGTLRYEVSDVQVLDKDELAAQATSLFDQTAEGGRLVVVSCEDWDGQNWLSNVVLTAEPAG